MESYSRVTPDMDVVILAAGRGTRFGASLPKCLVEFGGRSLLLRQLDALMSACPGLPLGCVHVVAGYRYDDVEEHLQRAKVGVHLVRNPFYECADILGSAWVSLPYIQSNNVFRTDADLLFSDANALRELFFLRETAMCFGTCCRRRTTPVMNVDRDRVQSVSLEEDYIGPDEWLCAEWYVGGDYEKVVSGAADLVPHGHYFEALNRLAAEIRPLAFGLRGAYEMDTLEDMEHVKRLLQGQTG